MNNIDGILVRVHLIHYITVLYKCAKHVMRISNWLNYSTRVQKKIKLNNIERSEFSN